MGGGVGFRFTPNFILSADGGYKQYTGNSGINGLYAGLALQINFETNAGDNGVDLTVVQETPVYPLFLALYQENPAAALRLRNLESAEIRNVRLSFRAGEFTSSEFNCGIVPLIPRGRTVEFPLYADFAPALLNVTENGRILGEVVIRYSFLGAERELIRSAALDVYNRGIFPSGDWTGLAAFVSPLAPEVLEFSKYITGLARTKRRTGLNGNLQFAVYLFHGLLENRIRMSGQESALRQGPAQSEVQYPFQTIAYRTGSLLDVGLLYAGTLEAAGIRAAIIPRPGTGQSLQAEPDFIIAFSLGITEAAAAGQFNGLDSLLIIDDEVWLPLSMGKFNDGFMESWKAGAQRLSAVFSIGENINFIVLEDAWSVYPPAPLPAQGIRINLPEQGAVNTAAAAALAAYIQQEIQPKIAAVQGRIRDPAGQQAAPQFAALYNQLGNLQVRAGNNGEAKDAFERAAGMGSVSAMINRGNIALLEKSYTQAEQWFAQALAADPGNAAALRGLEQTRANR
jgi:tetratricopeptide (TPR) repeat protein